MYSMAYGGNDPAELTFFSQNRWSPNPSSLCTTFGPINHKLHLLQSDTNESNRSFVVRANNVVSSPDESCNDAPHGCHWAGPLLFPMYMNYLPGLRYDNDRIFVDYVRIISLHAGLNKTWQSALNSDMRVAISRLATPYNNNIVITSQK